MPLYILLDVYNIRCLVRKIAALVVAMAAFSVELSTCQSKILSRHLLHLSFSPVRSAYWRRLRAILATECGVAKYRLLSKRSPYLV